MENVLITAEGAFKNVTQVVRLGSNSSVQPQTQRHLFLPGSVHQVHENAFPEHLSYKGKQYQLKFTYIKF